MDGGAWWAAVHEVSKSRTWLRDFPFTFHFHALEKEMATHSNSCLENPRDGGIWWASVYGVAQSRTRLKRLSSSSHSSSVSYSVTSNSWRPHGLQPTRLLHPWDFPGKSTGVGCQCLLLHVMAYISIPLLFMTE